MTNDILQNLTDRQREVAIAFEKKVLSHPAHLTGKDFVTKHHFAPGIYMREVHIPKGMITIGKIQKYPYLAILAKGKRKTTTNFVIETVTAPHVSFVTAGAKRMSEALEDSVFITVHRTDLTDIAEIERTLVCNSEEEYREFLAGSLKCLS